MACNTKFLQGTTSTKNLNCQLILKLFYWFKAELKLFQHKFARISNTLEIFKIKKEPNLKNRKKEKKKHLNLLNN